jgi:hypothetical protein
MIHSSTKRGVYMCVVSNTTQVLECHILIFLNLDAGSCPRHLTQ